VCVCVWIRYLRWNSALHYLNYRESSPVRWSCFGRKQVHEDMEVPLVGDNIRGLNVSLDKVSRCGESLFPQLGTNLPPERANSLRLRS